jgi:hypothetical protein
MPKSWLVMGWAGLPTHEVGVSLAVFPPPVLSQVCLRVAEMETELNVWVWEPTTCPDVNAEVGEDWGVLTVGEANTKKRPALGEYVAVGAQPDAEGGHALTVVSKKATKLVGSWNELAVSKRHKVNVTYGMEFVVVGLLVMLAPAFADVGVGVGT